MVLTAGMRGRGASQLPSERDEQLREMADVICGIGKVGAGIRTRRTGCADRKWDGRAVTNSIVMRAGCSKLTQSQPVGVGVRWTPCAAAG